MSDDLISADQAQALLDGATPRPWRVGPVDDTVVTAPGGATVAEIDGDYNEPDLWPVMEANARLIAAAPDLASTVIDQAAEITRLRAKVEAAEKLWKAASAADVVLDGEGYSLGAFPRFQIAAALTAYKDAGE